MPVLTSSPPSLTFDVERVTDRARYHLRGRPLLWRSLRELHRLPLDLTPAARDVAHKRVARRLLRHLRVDLRVSGLEYARGGPFLVASLHEGLVDVLCLLRLPLASRFVARGEIFGWPDVGPVLSRLGHVRIEPEALGGGYRGLLRDAGRVLAGGESLVVFPQGSVLGVETDFQRGVFSLARALRVPILPVVLTGTHRVWAHPFASTLRYGQRVGMRVLPPVRLDGSGGEALDEVRVRLRRRMKHVALSGELPAPRRFVPARDGYWDGYHFDIDPDFPEVFEQIARRRARALGGIA